MFQKIRKKATFLAVAIPLVAGAEGLRQHAYRDPVGIPTICFGETKGVKMGDKKTIEECHQMLGDRLVEFSDGVDSCVRVPLSDNRRAALVSLAYNIGVGAFCRSTLVRKINSNDPSACDEIMRFRYARGIPLPGLTKRRAVERDLCYKN